jgi:hypothetical protein
LLSYCRNLVLAFCHWYHRYSSLSRNRVSYLLQYSHCSQGGREIVSGNVLALLLSFNLTM